MCIVKGISNIRLKVSIFPIYSDNHLVVGIRVENVLMIEVHDTRGINQVRIQ